MRPPEHLGIKAEDIVCSGKARSWVMGQAWRDEAEKSILAHWRLFSSDSQ